MIYQIGIAETLAGGQCPPYTVAIHQCMDAIAAKTRGWAQKHAPSSQPGYFPRARLYRQLSIINYQLSTILQILTISSSLSVRILPK